MNLNLALSLESCTIANNLENKMYREEFESLAVQIAHETLEMYHELVRLRDENEKLREYRKLYMESLPAPRLQLRWAVAEQNAHRYQWACHYELVLPLGEYDIRREVYNEDGEITANVLELVVAMKPPTLRGSSGYPCEEKDGSRYFDPPFRDGAYAQWDAKVLGGLPIYVIAPDGEVFEQPNAK